MEEALQYASRLQTDQSKGKTLYRESGWIIEDNSLSPEGTFVASCSSWYADHVEDDAAIRFVFHEAFNATDVLIHTSRLKWAGGPLAALVGGAFLESTEKVVHLSPDDTPFAFEVIRNYLYLKTISVENSTVENLLQASKSAHRWELHGLLRLLCKSCEIKELPWDVDSITSGKDLIALPGVPEDFKTYFCYKVANLFDKLSPQTDAEERDTEFDVLDSDAVKSIIRNKSCMLFPEFWDLALSQGVIRHVMATVKNSSKQALNNKFLDLALICLEPYVEVDDDLLDILRPLVADCLNMDGFLQRSVITNHCSSRSLRLLSRVLLSEMYLGDCHEEHAIYSFSFTPMSSVAKKWTFGWNWHWNPNSSPQWNVLFMKNPGDDALAICISPVLPGRYSSRELFRGCDFKAYIIADECMCHENEMPRNGKTDQDSKCVHLQWKSGWISENMNYRLRVSHRRDSECSLRLICRVNFQDIEVNDQDRPAMRVSDTSEGD